MYSATASSAVEDVALRVANRVNRCIDQSDDDTIQRPPKSPTVPEDELTGISIQANTRSGPAGNTPSGSTVVDMEGFDAGVGAPPGFDQSYIMDWNLDDDESSDITWKFSSRHGAQHEKQLVMAIMGDVVCGPTY